MHFTFVHTKLYEDFAKKSMTTFHFTFLVYLLYCKSLKARYL